MSNRPRVFICSTIYDFADLRSALRHYLSSLGYDPLLSEYNDFRAPIDESSYDACTAAIGSCQYFILLIGSRVGGMYDSDERISITRHEYRLAYELLKQGKLKLIAFVRKSLWDVKEDRKSLVKHLENEWQAAKELSDEEIADISKHSSQFVNDADVLFSFIDEVGRKEEMRTAARSGSSRPIGNWIFQFVSFADIVDALRIQLNIDASIGEAAALGNLRREVVSNLQLLLDKSKDRIMAGHCFTDFLSGYNLDDYEGETSIPSGKLVWALIYMLTGFSIASRLSGRYAHEIIKTGQLQQLVEVNKTKSQNSPTLKNSQKFVKWGQWFNTRSNSEKVINFEITDFSMYGDFLPKIDASFL
jgi:hypothetical protein